ncbi:MAG: hypothetical protein HZA50_14780 [Planctomycetes bacterium]|nr:hypothetical protein [Planctomycetota bacterium]
MKTYKTTFRVVGIIFIGMAISAWLAINGNNPSKAGEGVSTTGKSPSETIIVPAATTGSVASQPASQQGKYRYVEEFGKIIGKLVDSGFVFIDGKYIESPYTVSRIGADIYINDILAIRGFWPLPQFDSYKDVVGIPPGLTEDMDYGDMMAVIEDHDSHKVDYLLSHPSKKTFAERYVEYLRQMPCVDHVEAAENEDNRILITMKNGEYHDLTITTELNDPNSVATKEKSQRKFNFDRDGIENNLRGGVCVIILKGLEMYNYEMKSEDTAKKLPLILDILSSEHKKKEKYELLVQMGYFDVYGLIMGTIDPFEEIILDHLNGQNTQLTRRLKDLADRLKIKPLTYDDLLSIDKIRQSEKYKILYNMTKEREQRKAAYRAKMATRPTTAPATPTEKK